MVADDAERPTRIVFRWEEGTDLLAHLDRRFDGGILRVGDDAAAEKGNIS